ncbi:MAG TPA: hypothetical protein VK647_05505 [Gemmatimonadales bacterium]|jgi:hypothetical protein|nr:hypothetical protein [Gemmatimonadales bacterium]
MPDAWNDAETLAELDRIEAALTPPWVHGAAAAAWQRQFSHSSPERNNASTTVNPESFQKIKLAAEHPAIGSEFIGELERRKRMSLTGELTPEAMEDAANAMILKHSTTLMRDLAIAEGRAPDTSGFSPAQLAKLRDANVSDQNVSDAAMFAAPGLSRADALKRWVAKGQKDAARTAPAYYDPNVSVPEESDI